MEFTVVGTYESGNAKFGKVLGNVAIVDCHYMHNLFFPALLEAIKPLQDEHPFEYLEFVLIIDSYRQAFKEKELTFCNFPMQYDGVLKDQASYYLTDYS